MEQNTSQQEERQKLVVEVNPEKFIGDGSFKYVTSVELCQYANEYFAAIFEDYEGSTFDYTPGSVPYISLYFNHIVDRQEGKIYACDRLTGKGSGNTIIDRSRRRDNQLQNGDRYYLTDDGKDIIIPMLLPRLFNGGKPDLKRIVTDVYDVPSGYGYFGNQGATQNTKVVGIDIKKIAAIKWGSKDPDTGDVYDYGFEIKGNSGRGIPGANAVHILTITQANNTELETTYSKLGIMVGNSNIIRKK